ncbi:MULTISPECIES: IS1/IS1595 family N-terminal zinc-binding domain-containing protein [Empedobacter]
MYDKINFYDRKSSKNVFQLITKLIKHGKTKNGNQRYKCKNCQKRV